MRKRQIQGLSTAPWLRAAVLAPVLASLLAVPCLAEARAGSDENSTKAEEGRKRRRDNVFGTTHDGIRTGRDPDTGDTVIRIRPPEKPKKPEYPAPPVYVEPKVEMPSNKGKGKK
jgi:hypothetical protein